MTCNFETLEIQIPPTHQADSDRDSESKYDNSTTYACYSSDVVKQAKKAIQYAPHGHKHIYLASYIYTITLPPKDDTYVLHKGYQSDIRIHKNRMGDSKQLIEFGATYHSLKFHTNPAVREAIADAEAIAKLSS